MSPPFSPPGRTAAVVLGFPRSGTTLLSRIFDGHPEVSAPPETNLLSACGRFLQESGEDGPPLGVLSGLALAGVPEEELLDALRSLVFSMHARLAGGKPVWMEKSGFDIFYLDAVERLLAGRCRFVCVVRHPLDVIASVRDLVDKAGHYMPELRPYLQRHDNPFEAFAEAWVDRALALRAFMERNGADSLMLRYEDLVRDPVGEAGRVADLLCVRRLSGGEVTDILARPGRIGLGDWKALDRPCVDAASVGRWRQALPRSVVSRLASRLAPMMEALGYPPPRASATPGRDETLRQFEIARRMQISMRGGS